MPRGPCPLVLLTALFAYNLVISQLFPMHWASECQTLPGLASECHTRPGLAFHLCAALLPVWLLLAQERVSICFLQSISPLWEAWTRLSASATEVLHFHLFLLGVGAEIQALLNGFG